MRRIGLRRALSTKPVPRQADPQFIQEDVDEHGHVITTTRRQPARKNSLLARVFRKKSRQSDDLHTIHPGEGLVVHPPPMHPSDEYDEPHSFAGAGNHLMGDPVPLHEHSVREHSVRDHSVRGHSVRDHHSARDHHSVRDQSVRGDYSNHGGTVYRDDVSRGYPVDYESTAGGTRAYERDYGHEGYGHDPHEHVTVMGGSPRQSHVTSPRSVTSPHSYHHVPVSAPGTVIHQVHDRHSRSGSSSRSSRSGVSRARTHAPNGEVEVNLRPGEKQEFVIGPNTQLIVPDDVELEISDGKGGWVPYHESLLRRPPREEVYVISGGSNFIVEDELGNILHRSQPSTYSGGPMSINGSATGRSTRSRGGETVYVDG